MWKRLSGWFSSSKPGDPPVDGEPSDGEEAGDGGLAISIAIGVALGVGIGAALGNVAIGIAIGVALGAAGIFVSKTR